MSKSVLEKVEVNYKGVSELLHSKEMEHVLLAEAQTIATKAGEGYVGKQMPTRVIAVEPFTDEAERDNYENNTLLKAAGD